jgi:rfaE bifunctional protein nucleotidyltransferase chain/domain
MDKLEWIKSKILSLEELNPYLSIYRFKEKKIIFTNGCFDLIHRGHIEYLARAANLGSIFIIGLNTDDSVKKIKGPGRPIQDEYSRAMILSSMGFVNHVVLFEEETPYELIKSVQPDILIKGGDYNPEEVVGYDLVKARGGQVIIIDLIKGLSTTGIINKLFSRPEKRKKNK